MNSDLSASQLQLLSEPRIATLATVGPDGFPQQTAVWFLFNEGKFYVASPQGSKKVRNIRDNDKVSILIENRELYTQYGLSAHGTAEIILGDQAEALRQQVHARYITTEGMADEQIGGFFQTLDDAAICITPLKWISWDMAELDEQVLSGRLKREELFHPTPV